MSYINFYFKELVHEGNTVSGLFLSPDNGISCRFNWNMLNDTCEICDNTKPIDEIMPLPLWWLRKKLNENGCLKENESKISY